MSVLGLEWRHAAENKYGTLDGGLVIAQDEVAVWALWATVVSATGVVVNRTH